MGGLVVHNDPVNKTDPNGEESSCISLGSCRLGTPGGDIGKAAAVTAAIVLLPLAVVAAPEIGAAITANAPALTEATAVVAEAVAPGAGESALVASSAVAGNMLGRELASADQMSQLAKGEGAVISQPAKQAERIASEYGGKAESIQKVSSKPPYTDKTGKSFETHAFRNAETGELHEPKTIIEDLIK